MAQASWKCISRAPLNGSQRTPTQADTLARLTAGRDLLRVDVVTTRVRVMDDEPRSLEEDIERAEEHLASLYGLKTVLAALRKAGRDADA